VDECEVNSSTKSIDVKSNIEMPFNEVDFDNEKNDSRIKIQLPKKTEEQILLEKKLQKQENARVVKWK